MPPDIDIFEPLPIEKQQGALARHLPVGRVWERCFDTETNLYKLIKGLSLEFFQLELLYQILSKNIDIVQTVDLIREWEKSVGLPNECISIDQTLEVRRGQVLQQFSNLGGVQTANDFIRVASLYGFVVQITPASGNGGLPYKLEADPNRFILAESAKALKYTIEVEIESGTLSPYLLKCVFEQLAPANVAIIIQGLPPAPPIESKMLAEDDEPLQLENSSFILLEIGNG